MKSVVWLIPNNRFLKKICFCFKKSTFFVLYWSVLGGWVSNHPLIIRGWSGNRGWLETQPPSTDQYRTKKVDFLKQKHVFL